MNWYRLVRFASGLLKLALPEWIAECPNPQCHDKHAYDLHWEKRGDDPTLSAYSLDGDLMTTKDALANAKNVAYWESKEHFVCPHCRTSWYGIATQQINPVFHMEPTIRILAIGNMPPAGGPFHDVLQVA
jgi:hypothetical protein